jgi:hypothetical protein
VIMAERIAFIVQCSVLTRLGVSGRRKWRKGGGEKVSDTTNAKHRLGLRFLVSDTFSRVLGV